MITTKTFARTETCTRINFILNHFRSALKRLTNYNCKEIETILDGIKNEEITSLEFIGYIKENDVCNVYVQLKLIVDWDEHHRLRKDQPEIFYDNKFDEGNCPEIYGLIILTQDTIFNKKLASNVLYGYSPKIKSNAEKLKNIRKKYGTSPSSTEYNYSNLKQTEECCAPEVHELSAKCALL